MTNIYHRCQRSINKSCRTKTSSRSCWKKQWHLNKNLFLVSELPNNNAIVVKIESRNLCGLQEKSLENIRSGQADLRLQLLALAWQKGSIVVKFLQ